MEYYREAKTLVIDVTNAQTLDLSSASYNHKALMFIPVTNLSAVVASLQFYSKGAISSFIASTGATVDYLNVTIPASGTLYNQIADLIIPARVSSIKFTSGTSGTILVVLLN